MIASPADLVTDEFALAEREATHFVALLSSAAPAPAACANAEKPLPPMPAIGEPLLLALALAFANLKRPPSSGLPGQLIVSPADRVAFTAAFLAVVARGGVANGHVTRRNLQSMALMLFGTLDDAWQAHVGAILDEQAGRTAAAEHKRAKAQLRKLLDRHAAVEAFGVLQAAALWGSGDAVGMVEAPRRARTLDGADDLAAFIWRRRASIAFPPLPALPDSRSPDAFALFAMAAAAWSAAALRQVEAELKEPPLAAIHRLRVAAVAAEMAAALGVRDGLSKSLDLDTVGQTFFGRFVAALHAALGAATAAHIAGMALEEERRAFLTLSQALPVRASSKQLSDARKKLSLICK